MQIEEAVRRAKCKKVLYLYDETGNKQLLGVFSRKRADEIKDYFRDHKLINRLTESDIRTTEPDTDFERFSGLYSGRTDGNETDYR